MTVNRLATPPLTLGDFLRDRRARLAPEPAAQGTPATAKSTPSRRRTPGLRREEVAARAGVSVVWYTWLEQGRGGPPSAEALERLALALELEVDERELLFLLGQQRPPPVDRKPTAAVPASVQRVLDAMPTTPAYVKTPTWDIVAWNDAARVVLADYGAMPPADRNVLRRLFGDDAARARLTHWEADVRAALAAFRVDIARMGGSAEADALVAELHAVSADFRRLWAEHDVRSHGVWVKHLQHPVAGPLVLECAAFSVDGADGLGMIVCSPAGPEDAAAIGRLLAGRSG